MLPPVNHCSIVLLSCCCQSAVAAMASWCYYICLLAAAAAVITGGLDSKLVMWDFSEGRPQKLVDFGVPDADSRGSAGQCLNLAFVHAIAIPEVDTVDRLGKTRNLLRIAIFNISYIRGLFPEKYFNDKTVPALVSLSSSDLLQKDNVSNQREHIVLLLANQQTRLRIPDELEPVEESKFVIEAKTIQRM
ncbi:hypothetical protein ACSBR1_025581 [Camellia fascicularis]